MKPEEVNKALAEKCMGWTWIDRLHCKDQQGHYVIDGIEWDPWHRIDHAMMCLEKFSDYGVEKRTWDDGKITYRCGLMDANLRQFRSEWVENLNTSICDALMQAVRSGKKQDEEI